MPGQCLRMPSCTWANKAGSDDELSSGLRTWMWTSEAPASNASWVDSICSDTVTGSAGLSFLRGTDPVIATVITAGLMILLLSRMDAPQLGAIAASRVAFVIAALSLLLLPP